LNGGAAGGVNIFVPDGKVVLDIASDPSMPLGFRLQYRRFS
jgi:hypothetical protein